MNRSPITTHVLDAVQGQPAKGLSVVLEFRSPSGWIAMGRGVTDADGRASNLLPAGIPIDAGDYRLSFDTGAWQEGFFPEVTITFRVASTSQHYHVPLLLGPWGYTTYRGS